MELSELYEILEVRKPLQAAFRRQARHPPFSELIVEDGEMLAWLEDKLACIKTASTGNIVIFVLHN